MNSVLFGCVLWLATAAVASAQRPGDVVHWTLAPASATVAPGGVFKVQLHAAIDEGWHVYGLTQNEAGPPPLSIAVAKGRSFDVKTQDIEAPAPTVANDPSFGLETFYYEREVSLSVPIAAARTAKTGRTSVPIEVTFQACNNRICLRPFTETLSIDTAVRTTAKGRR